MASNPIINALTILKDEIVQEEALIQASQIRIEELKFNFMLSSKNKILAIKNLQKRILSSRTKIVDLKKRKTIISVT